MKEKKSNLAFQMQNVIKGRSKPKHVLRKIKNMERISHLQTFHERTNKRYFLEDIGSKRKEKE